MSNEKSKPPLKKEPGINDEKLNPLVHHPLPEHTTKLPERLPELSTLDYGFTHNTRNGAGRSGGSNPNRHCFYPSRGGRGAMKCDACYDYNKGVAQGCCLQCLWKQKRSIRVVIAMSYSWSHSHVHVVVDNTCQTCAIIVFAFCYYMHMPYKMSER
jgi:hypothetical protein